MKKDLNKKNIIVPKIKSGLVLRCSKHLFLVRSENEDIECRIKGKTLKNETSFYNALAPGDKVLFSDKQILELEERKNIFSRYNQKGRAVQLIAANVDYVLCVTCPSSPPFRPRFIDRVLIQAEHSEIPAAIVCNKYDLSSDPEYDNNDDILDMEERLSDFEKIGYPVFYRYPIAI